MIRRTLKHFFAIVALGVVVTTLGFFAAPRLLAQVKAALVRDLDNPARSPVQFELYFGGAVATYTVPAGKTLVIEDVSLSTASAGTFGIYIVTGGVGYAHFFPPLGYANGVYYGGRTTRLYADAGSMVQVQTQGPVNTGLLIFSGYLVDNTL